MSSQTGSAKKGKPLGQLKSALSQKLNRRHQSGTPPKPPSRDFVDTKVNGEEESAGAASVSSDMDAKSSAAMSDGYQQVSDSFFLPCTVLKCVKKPIFTNRLPCMILVHTGSDIDMNHFFVVLRNSILKHCSLYHK